MYGIQRDADYFVIETGLGGRLDCTNVINPEISVITTIGFDHIEILGKEKLKICFVEMLFGWTIRFYLF